MWKEYRKKGTTEMRLYRVGEKISNRVSISPADIDNGSPKPGDMIARNPNNPDDMWLVDGKYFKDNYELAE